MVAVLAIAVACYFAGCRRADVPVHAAALDDAPAGAGFCRRRCAGVLLQLVSLPRTELGLELSHFQGEWSGTICQCPAWRRR